MAFPVRSSPYVRSFAFDDGQEQVFGGSAVLVSPDCLATLPEGDSEPEDFGWSKAQTEAFLAGEPLTLRFVTQAPEPGGSKRVFVCCWITLESQ